MRKEIEIHSVERLYMSKSSCEVVESTLVRFCHTEGVQRNGMGSPNMQVLNIYGIKLYICVCNISE